MQSKYFNKKIGHTFIELKKINSTNNYAREAIETNMAEHGMAYFAHEQTSGKGQRGKRWETSQGENILLSVVVDASFLKTDEYFLLITMSALAVHDFFFQYCNEDIFIKWPNDLYWKEKKAGGILIENKVGNNILDKNVLTTSIIGIGININQLVFDQKLINPVSLKQITGKTFNIVQLAKELCDFLEIRYQQLLRGEFLNLVDDYNRVLYKIGEGVRLKIDNKVFDCKVKHVDRYGELWVENAPKEQYSFGEVEWIIQ